MRFTHCYCSATVLDFNVWWRTVIESWKKWLNNERSGDAVHVNLPKGREPEEDSSADGRRRIELVTDTMLQPTLYCIVSMHLYSASHSAHQSEALPVRETQGEETTTATRYSVFGFLLIYPYLYVCVCLFLSLVACLSVCLSVCRVDGDFIFLRNR